MNKISVEQLQQEIKKLKFQVRYIGQALDMDKHPIENLVASLDWGQEDLNDARDIFGEYYNKMEAGEEVKWAEFEMRLRDKFRIGHEKAKQIIHAFYREGQWRDVCRAYARVHDVSEFKYMTTEK